MTNVPATFQGGAASAQPLSLGDVTKRLQRPRRVVPLYLDSEAASQIAEAEQALERAREYDETTNEPDTAPALAQHLQSLEERAEASRVLFLLQAVTHRRYRQLIGECPPTQKQIDEARERGNGDETPVFDPDALAPALVRHQLLEPSVTGDDEFAAFWDGLSDGQLSQLWQAALEVQLGVTDPGPKSETASDVLRSFGLS